MRISAIDEWGVRGVLWGVALLVGFVFLWIMGDIFLNGLRGLTLSYLLSEPMDAGRAGGIFPILVSTLLVVMVCALVSVPIAIGCAILLSEFMPLDAFYGRVIRYSLNVLSGVPSIVFGLFGNAFFCQLLGLGYSILSGGLTLACMVLPILIRTAEEGLRAVPNENRQGAAALGISMASTLRFLLLPLAMPGILVGLGLGVGRAVAETAALIFTSGYVDRMPESLLDSGRVLSLHIFDLTMNISGGERSAYQSAVTLILLLTAIHVISHLVGEKWFRRSIAL